MILDSNFPLGWWAELQASSILRQQLPAKTVTKLTWKSDHKPLYLTYIGIIEQGGSRGSDLEAEEEEDRLHRDGALRGRAVPEGGGGTRVEGRLRRTKRGGFSFHLTAMERELRVGPNHDSNFKASGLLANFTDSAQSRKVPL